MLFNFGILNNVFKDFLEKNPHIQTLAVANSDMIVHKLEKMVENAISCSEKASFKNYIFYTGRYEFLELEKIENLQKYLGKPNKRKKILASLKSILKNSENLEFITLFNEDFIIDSQNFIKKILNQLEKKEDIDIDEKIKGILFRIKTVLINRKHFLNRKYSESLGLTSSTYNKNKGAVKIETIFNKIQKIESKSILK